LGLSGTLGKGIAYSVALFVGLPPGRPLPPRLLFTSLGNPVEGAPQASALHGAIVQRQVERVNAGLDDFESEIGDLLAVL
jgi:hypothetical protein